MNNFLDDKSFKRLLLFVFFSLILYKSVENYTFFFEKLSKLITTLTPFLWGIGFAYILNPAMMFFEEKLKIKKRVISLVIVYFIFSILVVISAKFIIPVISENISELYTLSSSIPTVIDNYLYELQRNGMFDGLGIENILKENSSDIAQWIFKTFNLSVNSVFFTAMNITSGLLNFILGIFVSIYFLNDKERLLKYLKKVILAFLKKEKSDLLFEYFSRVNYFFYNFLVGKLIDSTIIGILCYIGLMILGIKYALLLSIIVGVLNMIPYFGPFMGAVPAVTITLIYSPIQALWVALFILVLQQFDGWYLGPKILGNTVGAKPLSIIFAILIGGSFGGALGMLIAVPLYRSITILWDTFIDRKLMEETKK